MSVQVVLQEEQRDNLTVSVMSFVPTLEDDNKPLSCRAENPNVTSLALDTSWTISVVCKFLPSVLEPTTSDGFCVYPTSDSRYST